MNGPRSHIDIREEHGAEGTAARREMGEGTTK